MDKRQILQIERKDNKGYLKYTVVPNYKMKKDFFTTDEYRLYRCLEEIYKNTSIKILAQVSLLQMLEVNNRRHEQQIRNRIASKSIDFVLYDTNLAKIICCIELNGSSHQMEDRKKRDDFLKETFEFIEIPMIFIDSKNNYSQELIKKEIDKKILEKEEVWNRFNKNKYSQKCD